MTSENSPTTKAELDPQLRATGFWCKPRDGKQQLLVGISGNGSSVGAVEGVLSLEGPSRGQMKAGYIEVFDTNNRGHGLGRRVLQSFVAEAKLAGATTLVGDIKSPQEIHNRLQVFGEDNVTFFEDLSAEDGGDSTVVELPLTREQAIDSLLRAQLVDSGATIGA